MCDTSRSATSCRDGVAGLGKVFLSGFGKALFCFGVLAKHVSGLGKVFFFVFLSGLGTVFLLGPGSLALCGAHAGQRPHPAAACVHHARASGAGGERLASAQNVQQQQPPAVCMRRSRHRVQQPHLFAVGVRRRGCTCMRQIFHAHTYIQLLSMEIYL